MFFSRIRIRIFGRSGTGLRKKSLIRIRKKKPGSKTLVQLTLTHVKDNTMMRIVGLGTL